VPRYQMWYVLGSPCDPHAQASHLLFSEIRSTPSEDTTHKHHVIASEAKQSIITAQKTRWIASVARNDGEDIMTDLPRI